MLNMTAVRTSLEKGRRAGILFAFGASFINCLQSLIAFSFIRFLDSNPNVIEWLKRIAIIVLLSLAYFFYKQSKKVISAKKNTKGFPSYVEGALLSSLNMLALPYYFASALALEASGQIEAVPPYIYQMAVGVFIGGFLVFGIYVYLADIVARRSEFITKNINLLLAGFFVLLACVVTLNLIF